MSYELIKELINYLHIATHCTCEKNSANVIEEPKNCLTLWDKFYWLALAHVYKKYNALNKCIEF